MTKLSNLIYSPEKASGEAISKVETHTPKIVAPYKVEKGEVFKIKVSVGPHPNTVEHSIRWIEVYYEEEGRAFNPIMLARAEFAPGMAEPEIEISVKLSKSGRIIALEYCNLHGLWENSKEIIVE